MNPESAPPRIVPQKLVTIYLDNMAYAKGKLLVGSLAEKHGLVEEHLGDLLSQGWRVVAIHGFGGSAETVCARGWLTILLEWKGP